MRVDERELYGQLLWQGIRRNPLFVLDTPNTIHLRYGFSLEQLAMALEWVTEKHLYQFPDSFYIQ